MNGLSDAIGRFGLHRAGREWRGKCPVCGYKDAFVMSLKNGRPIGWCASCQDRAAIGALIQNSSGWLPPETRSDPAAAQRQQAKQGRALTLWAGAVAAVGTIADVYLSSRGLPGLAASESLRFRGDTPHPSGGSRPAMLALVVDVAGQPLALHRTFISPPGQKADVEPNRASLGPLSSGAIRLDAAAAELVVGEGIETAASAGRILQLPAWAATSSGNLATGLLLPESVRSIYVAADRDEPGEHAAQAAAARWTVEGRHVRIVRPRRAGDDFNDILVGRLRGTNAP